MNVQIDIDATSPDLLVKGGDLYGYWDGKGWRRELNDFIHYCDHILDEECERLNSEGHTTDKGAPITYIPKHIRSSITGELNRIASFFKNIPQTSINLDSKIVFPDHDLVREDYATRTLPYIPTEGDTPAFDELFGVLYRPEELQKVLWFSGALLLGKTSRIQKFLYLYGGKGTGKGTLIKVVRKLFDGYCGEIDLMLLTSGDSFGSGQVRDIPVLIDEDCDISKIRNDTNLLKLTAHEPVLVNQKYKVPYESVFNGMLICASNERYKVKHVDAGITRRAIVVEPTSQRLNGDTYTSLMEQIDFEIPAIAQKCIDIYQKLGRSYYEDYVDIASIEETDIIFAFVTEYRDKLGNEVSLTSAAALYLEYLNEYGYNTEGYKRTIKRALRKYYKEFSQRKRINNVQVHNVFSDFKTELFESVTQPPITDSMDTWIDLSGTEHILQKLYPDAPAQYATMDGTPEKAWDNVTTTLSDINETLLHYVRVPINHIVIDFDLKDDTGEKNLKLNVKAATKFPKTYAEVSKSGNGLHLHYIYTGDPERLSSLYDEDIEIKVFKGKTSLRRALTKCNDISVSELSSGLPLKEEKDMYSDNQEIIWNENKIRTAIKRNLRKEYHNATKPSIDFIYKILTDAEAAGIEYDVSDMEQAVTLFAMSSTNQSRAALSLVAKMPFKTKEEPVPTTGTEVIPNQQLWTWDVEVYPNVFIVVAKSLGTGKYIKLINPDRYQIEDLLKKPLMGFNNLKYDNHIMYGALMGEANIELFHRSQAIINNEPGGTARNAYGLSYLDIYEMSTKKQSLKKWEVELGIRHDEMDWPWDKPLPEELWERAVEYCTNDVDATEKVFYACADDYNARCILAAISGLPINSKTQDQTARILFGDDPRPQDKFVYTDLSKEFPGYTYQYKEKTITDAKGVERTVKTMVSDYRGEDPSEGGYVYAEPGIYKDVVLLDVASEHPTSAIELNYFGPYTKNYADLKQARIEIKHGNYDNARKMFGGRLAPFLNDESSAKKLAYSLKIPINIVYGMTSAKFDNKFKHPDNIDNIVAKRGALFMINLKHEVQERGYTVAHIKTDSIKIPNGDPEIIKFVMEYGQEYGYDFEHEHTYKRMALVNKSTYIAQLEDDSWEATGAQFAEPYVFKKLFSKEELQIEDYFITKSTTAAIYLDSMFVGKVAQVYASLTGYTMVRDDGVKQGAISGTKGYKFRLASEFKGIKDIDMTYYDELAKKAVIAITKVGATGLIIDDIPKEYEMYSLPF